MCSKRTAQVHMKVLQVFESDGCLYVHKEYPQRHGGETHPSLWTNKTKAQQKMTGLHFNPEL